MLTEIVMITIVLSIIVVGLSKYEGNRNLTLTKLDDNKSELCHKIKEKDARIKELEENSYVSPEDGYHVKIGSKEYFKIIFDENKCKELFKNLNSVDPLEFKDTKTYKQRIR